MPNLPAIRARETAEVERALRFANRSTIEAYIAKQARRAEQCLEVILDREAIGSPIPEGKAHWRIIESCEHREAVARQILANHDESLLAGYKR